MKKSVVLALSLAFVAAACSQKESDSSMTEYKGYELSWSDEFDKDGMVDERYWGYDEGYCRNNELQDYKKADSKYARVENGLLVIEAHRDSHMGVNKWTGEPYKFEYSSAEVKSLKTIPMKYGRVDVSARIPIGKGVWPAIWMMPLDNKYGGWPHSGEIDIMEYVYGDSIHNQVFSTVHTADIDVNKNYISSGLASSETLNSEFHLYSLVWDEDYLEILFDNNVVFTYRRGEGASPEKWPFDQPFYLILNIAVGGGWGGIWGIDETIFPVRMEIDYVRCYQKKTNK